MRGAEVVDSHVHIWLPETSDRPWEAAFRGHAPAASFLVADVMHAMAMADVSRAVLIPPSFEGDRNDAVLDAAARFPKKFAVMGRVGLSVSARTCLRVLKAWRRQTGMKGIRVTLYRDHEIEALRRGELDWLWRRASEFDLPIMVS